MRKLLSLRNAAIGGAVVMGLLLGATTVIAETTNTLNITEVYTATRVSRGVPETRTTTFERNSGFIYCFVRIENPSGNGNELLVAFEPATGEPTSAVRGIRLRIPPRYRYRTVARTGSNMAAGQHRCVVRSRTGEVLQHTNFQVTE